jgi:DNA-directed RNA polymerase specialized sigma24 family protein
LETSDLKELLRACAQGDADNRVRFQNAFGEAIYNYPIKTFRLSADKAGDFYIYVFEDDRIFRRVSRFEARNGAQFQTYLNFYVLRDLLFEWRRAQKEPETISLATVVSDGSSDHARTLEDVLANNDPSPDEISDSMGHGAALKAFMESLDAETCLLLKLLYLAETDLSPSEIRLLCKKSGRSYREIIFEIEETRTRLRKKDQQLTAIDEQLESIHGWILCYQKELRQLTEKIAVQPDDAAEFNDDRQKCEELARKLAWRYRQQRQAVEKRRQFRITTPYKDIARLVNAPIGTVCSLVARSREDISSALGRSQNLGEAVGT